MKYTPDFSSRFRILKGGKISLVVSALIAGSTMSFAAPTGGQVTTGSAAISQNGSVTTINQSTNKASINWNSFSIAPTETVNFVQPSASSVTLNRVIGTSQSLIEGAMNANGQVFLINPNGVLFANGSQINVGGLVASTLNITDENFQSGNYVFEGNSQNSIINMGSITANNGGYVALMGKTVANEGTIVATMGNVQMASGEKISLNLNGNSLVKLTIDQGTMDALVENKGLIQADGGQVYLTTQALNTILDGMVNNTGIIEAKTLNDVTGKVILYAHGGTANISGEIKADGGFVETSGERLHVSDATTIQAKTWLLDPTNIIVGSAGSEALSGTPATTATAGDVTVSGATINASLNNGTSVLLDATNNITINDNISKTNGVDATLTFKAGGNIVLEDGKTIASTSNKLNTVFWADSDATSGGSIYMKNGSSITTNGGHLWMGGGSGSSTWNGLTVGDGYAIGTSAGIDLTDATLVIANENVYGTGNRYHYNGITLLNNNINTSGGDFKASGKSYNAAVTTGKAYIGVFIGGDYQISTSAGDIVLDGISTISANDISWYNGVALGSANSAGTANATLITTSGDIAITGEVNQNFEVGHARAISMAVWGLSNKLNLKTTSGNISLTGDNKSTVSNSRNRAIGNDVDGYRFTEISSATGNIDITGIGANTGGYDIGLKNAIIKTDGVITITGDTLNLLSSYLTGSQISSVTSGVGSLIIKPYTASTSIGIGGATGTLALTSAYFSTNFLDGFSNITIGSATAGDITVGGTTTYNDNLTFKTAGSIIFNAASSLVGLDASDPNLILWSDADANSAGGTWLASTSSITTNGGSVTIGGGANPVTDYAFGANLGALDDGESNAGYRGATINGSISSGGGNIIINGRGYAPATSARGVSIDGSLTTSGAGTITINGIADGTSDGIGTSGTITSENGNIVINGAKDTGANGVNISGGSVSATGSGNISLTASSGTIGLVGNVSTNTGTIALNSATALTQGAGVLSGNALVLAGTSAYTLTNTSNAMSSLASSGTLASLSYVDSNALSLGTITATGAINIATLSGDMTLTGAVSTESTSDSAIILNAGKSTAAGTSTDGNIIHTSGTITTGTDGRATIYSGSVSGSTGLTGLIGSGSGKFRYNSDEAATGYTAVLGTGTYAIYREHPTLSVTPSTATSIAGNAIDLTGVSGTLAGVNGDTSTTAGITGTATFATVATSGSAIGTYDIAYTGGLTNTVGYLISDATGSTGEYSVTAATPEPLVEQELQVENIITTIVNSTIITTPSPMVMGQQQMQTQVQNNTLLQSILPSSQNSEHFNLVGTTDGQEVLQTVSMEQLQTGNRGQGVNEIRVALGQESFVELINGGVKLPLGLSQEFYVVNNNKQEKK